MGLQAGHHRYEADQFRYPESGLQGNKQQGPVAPGDPGGQDRGGDERGRLLRVEEVDGPFPLPLFRDDQHLLAVQEEGWLADGKVSEESLDC